MTNFILPLSNIFILILVGKNFLFTVHTQKLLNTLDFTVEKITSRRADFLNSINLTNKTLFTMNVSGAVLKSFTYTYPAYEALKVTAEVIDNAMEVYKEAYVAYEKTLIPYYSNFMINKNFSDLKIHKSISDLKKCDSKYDYTNMPKGQCDLDNFKDTDTFTLKTSRGHWCRSSILIYKNSKFKTKLKTGEECESSKPHFNQSMFLNSLTSYL